MKYAKWLLAFAVAFLIACSSPKTHIQEAEDAIRRGDYVKAAHEITQVEQREVDKLEKELKVRYQKVITDIARSEDEAAIDVLLKDYETRF